MKNLFLSSLVLFTTMMLFSCQPYGKKVTINDHLEVYVKNDATQEEGKKLGDYFATFDTSTTHQKSIQLSKDADLYSVRLVVPDVAANDPDMVDAFQSLQYLIQQNVFPGQSVKLILTDEKFNDKKEVAPLQEEENEMPADTMPADSTSPK